MTVTAQALRRAREYETIYILRSTIDRAGAAKVLERIREVVAARGGSLLQVENWGRRKLAYLINKASRGVFVYVRYAGYEDLVHELERNLRLLDGVIRFQTVLLHDDVDMADYTVDPAELEFGELAESADEEESSLAQRLGLVERPRGSSDDGERDRDYKEDSGDDDTDGSDDDKENEG